MLNRVELEKSFITSGPGLYKSFVIRAGIHKMLVRVANREDPDQTASLEAV